MNVLYVYLRQQLLTSTQGPQGSIHGQNTSTGSLHQRHLSGFGCKQDNIYKYIPAADDATNLSA